MIKILILVAVVMVIACLLLCFYYNRTLHPVYYEILDSNIPDAFRGSKVVMLSDLHNYTFGKDNEKLLHKIDLEKPDYIMIVGDLLVKAKKLYTTNAVTLLQQLAKKYPVYYAPGNHEEELERQFREDGSYLAFIQMITEAGVHYLANESVYLEKNGEKIRVTGLHLEKKYFSKAYKKVDLEMDELKRIIGEKKEEYEILLAHNPVYFPVYARWGANLVLSGHVHGGVVILPFLGGVLSTAFELFPKYDYGLFECGKAKMVLSKGLAMHTIKLRLFNKPEISVIKLDHGKDLHKNSFTSKI